MEIKIRTHYDRDALTAMARGLRRTVRRKRSRITRVLGVCIALLGISLGLGELLLNPPEIGWPSLLAGLVVTAVLLTEDRVNGRLARSKMLPGTAESVTRFGPEGYETTTQAGTMAWKYENILAIAEGKRYFVFALSQRHAQAYDKQGFLQGTPEELRTLLRDKTGLPVTKM